MKEIKLLVKRYLEVYSEYMTDIVIYPQEAEEDWYEIEELEERIFRHYGIGLSKKNINGFRKIAEAHKPSMELAIKFLSASH